MVTIPSGADAQRAWAALPRGVRAEAQRLAALGQGHPDPAVAAAVVGRIRAQAWPWWRTALSITGMSLFLGEVVALMLLGGEIRGETTSQILIGDVPAVAGFLLLLGATTWFGKRTLPRAAEVPNLVNFLASPHAQAPAVPSAPRRWLTPRRAAVVAAVVPGVTAVAWAAAVLLDEPLRPEQGLQGTFGGALLFAVVLGAAAVVRRRWRLPHGKREARRVRVSEAGLAFDRRSPIPWTDVLGVTLIGPTTERPNGAGAIIWTLREPPIVESPLHGSQPPEELILAARAYTAAAKAATRAA